MSITSKLFLDSRRTKKDGTQRLKLRITIDRKSLEISFPHAFNPRDWDAGKMELKPRYKSPDGTGAMRLNNMIANDRSDILDTLIDLQRDGVLAYLSMREVKSRLTSKNKGKLMLLVFLDEVISEMKSARRNGNARVYQTLRNSLSDYLNEKDIPINQVTFRFLKKYESWYRGKGNSVNGLSVKMRTLRALLNRAIKERRLDMEAYPFRDYNIKKEDTRKRAISQEDLEKIKAFTPTTDRQMRAKSYFLMSFYLMGASWVDMVHLKLSDISGGRVRYKRRKTGREHNIPLSPQLTNIIDQFSVGKSKHDYILNVLKSSDPARQNVESRDELRRYNRTLKDIAELCGIDTPLTSYTARHTYATLAKYKGVPTAVISESLGHSSEQVTQIYLNSFLQETVDEYHQKVIG